MCNGLFRGLGLDDRNDGEHGKCGQQVEQRGQVEAGEESVLVHDHPTGHKKGGLGDFHHEPLLQLTQ